MTIEFSTFPAFFVAWSQYRRAWWVQVGWWVVTL